VTAPHSPSVARTLAQLRMRPPTLDVTEAAGWLGVGRSSAYEAIRRGDFPAKTITVNRRLRVLTASLIRVLEDGEVAGSH
jgi:predicted DNA-binding transcriptional regulator AlpA